MECPCDHWDSNLECFEECPVRKTCDYWKNEKEKCVCDCINHPHTEPCFECNEIHGDYGIKI
jgi:hypothetical protein